MVTPSEVDEGLQNPDGNQGQLLQEGGDQSDTQVTEERTAVDRRRSERLNPSGDQPLHERLSFNELEVSPVGTRMVAS